MIQPVGNKLLARPIKKEDEKIGAIFIPGVANANLSSAEIVRISDECPVGEDGKSLYTVGDVVVFSEGSGLGHREGGDFFIWLQFGEIWGIDVPEEDKKVKKLKRGI